MSIQFLFLPLLLVDNFRRDILVSCLAATRNYMRSRMPQRTVRRDKIDRVGCLESWLRCLAIVSTRVFFELFWTKSPVVDMTINSLSLPNSEGAPSARDIKRGATSDDQNE